MNNYEYIVACLPEIEAGTRELSPDADTIIGDILEQLSASDRKAADIFLEGFNQDSLNRDFYLKATDSRLEFIREYFRFDLGLRNAKVDYLNRALGRSEGTDRVDIGGNDGFEYQDAADAILGGRDILERERGLDNLLWDRIDSLSAMHVFDLTQILGFIAKLKIVDRWMKLDEETGRSLFRKFVEEIRKSKNI